MIILSLFLLAQIVGLAANLAYLKSELPYGLQPPKLSTEASPLFFIGMIIVISAVFFAMKKFKFELLMKAWFFLAFISCVAITLSAFIAPWIALAIALAIGMIRFKKRNLYVHNLGEILIYGGAVAIFAPVLNLWTAIVLLIAISIYDYISIFVTKHMIGLAKMQEELGIFSGLIVVNKNEFAVLGGGDIAFTLLFATVVLKQFGVAPAIFSIYGAAIFIMILAAISKKKKYYPAMPFVTMGSLLGFLISLI